MNTSTGSNAAILVMENGALWPGPMLDWASDVSVVAQGRRGTADALLRGVRRAARSYASSSYSVGCVLVSFADAPGSPTAKFRENLVLGLGALAPEIGCRRLILAGYHVERLEFRELVTLAQTMPGSDAEDIEICFRRARRRRMRIDRTR